MPDDLGLTLALAEAVAVEDGIAVAGQQQRLELDGRADVVGQALDEEGLALLTRYCLPPVLMTA